MSMTDPRSLTDDVLIDANVAFRDRAVAAGARVTADFGPGAHDWAYWDARIPASSVKTAPRAVASLRPSEPPMAIGLPVTTPGMV